MADNTGIEAAQVVNHMKKKGSFKIIIFGFIIGVALLLIGSFALPSEKKSAEKTDDVKNTYEEFLAYKETVRREIEELCMSVSGVKSAEAVVFFDGLGESIYATNAQSGNSDKIEYVIIGSGSNAHALYLGESLPALVGIGVVCDTGGNAGIKNELAALLSAAYGLPLTRVRVVEY